MELKTFLIEAKGHSYATGEEGKKLADGSKEFVYSAHGYTYRDRYLGEDPFIGEEIIWDEKHVIWGMNFYGRVLSDAVPAGEVYTFLQKAMRLVREDRPFRGPEKFSEGDFAYVDENQGTVNGFMGTEKIFFKGEEVYRLDYHGGAVKPA